MFNDFSCVLQFNLGVENLQFSPLSHSEALGVGNPLCRNGQVYGHRELGNRQPWSHASSAPIDLFAPETHRYWDGNQLIDGLGLKS